MKVCGTHRQSSCTSRLLLFHCFTNCFTPDHVNCEKTFLFLSLSSSSGPSSSSHIFLSCFTCPVCHTANCLSLHSDHPCLLPLISPFHVQFSGPFTKFRKATVSFVILTFSGPCIVICCYNKTKEMH